MIKEITSSSNSLIKELIKLKQTRNAKEQNKIIIEGKDLIDLASDNGLLDMILTTEESYDYNCDKIICPMFILEKLSSNKSTPNIIGIAHYPQEELKLAIEEMRKYIVDNNLLAGE